MKNRNFDEWLSKFRPSISGYDYYIVDQKLINKDDEKLYDQLKDAIYSLSLDIKSAKVCNQISPVEAEEMKEYYWGLLL